MIKGAPAREGTKVLNAEGEEVGVVTSGSHSPCLKKGIGMCYVAPQYNKVKSPPELYVARSRPT